MDLPVPQRGLNSLPIWLNEPAIFGLNAPPSAGGILIIGSGLTGVSAAYWLEKSGIRDITMVDFRPDEAASFRNCGHILYGTVESMEALVALHGYENAREIWSFSIGLCEQVRETIAELGIEADYRQDGYLVIAVDESEDREIIKSTALLNHMGFQSRYCAPSELELLGFKNTFGGRFEQGSAQAHPVKFRNGLLRHCLSRGLKYHSGCQVTSIDESRDQVIATINGKPRSYDAAVIATNAYSPLVSNFFARHQMIEPFRGQIIASKPLKSKLPVTFPHSFDHGYEYAIRSADNRLILGGWRNHCVGREMGTYDLGSNPQIDRGLMEFAKRHYGFLETINWEYSWTGIMGASRTGFPYIGPTDQPRVFTCAGYTGHGFSWAHGSAKLLADIIVGNSVPAVARFFKPTKF